MGWLITIGILVLLAVLPLGVSVHYGGEGVQVKIIAGPLRLQVVPSRNKSDKEEKNQSENKQEKKNPKGSKPSKTASAKVDEGKPADKKKGGSILDFLPLVKVGLDFLAEFFGKKLHVNCLELKLTLAGGDPCDLALNYGRAWEALGNLWPRLERMMVIQKRDINIQCDFEGDKTLIYTRLDISITLGRLLGIAVRYGWRALVTFLKIRKKRKGGAKT